MAEPVRETPLAGLAPDAIVSNASVSISPSPPITRFVLRATDGLAVDLAHSAGFEHAPAMLRFQTVGNTSMARLGPDEYLISGADADCITKLRQRANTQFAAITDISHRMAAIHISGTCATSVINGACPLDLHVKVSPIGLCTRSVMGKAEIILQRLDERSFLMLTNRSLTEYLWLLLAELAREHSQTDS